MSLMPDDISRVLSDVRSALAAADISQEQRDERFAVVTEYLSWVGTPYHHAARVKGVGVDCAMIHAEVWSEVGLIPALKIDHYPPDWHCHQNEERYLGQVLQFARKVETDKPLPGDLAMYQFGRCAAHGAAVLVWPAVIHSLLNNTVSLDNALQGRLASRFKGFFRFRKWAVA